ncbi:MAG: cellulase family glycosylhydrolase, partial [Oligoflexales bacterium]|nr:cellulase family glycosylhydrolase [Oligoflexales bacterium]
MKLKVQASYLLIVLCIVACTTRSKTEMKDGIEKQGTTLVIIDPNTAVSKDYSGIGVQLDPYEWFDLSKDQWSLVEKRMDFLRPAFIRTMIRGYWYTEGIDRNGVVKYKFDSPRMKKLYQILDYAKARNINVMLGEWDSPSFSKDDSYSKEDSIRNLGIKENDPRWANMIGGLLVHLVKKKGYSNIKWFNYVNEPNGDWSGCADFSRWKEGMTHLARQLRLVNLDGKIRIVGPDASGDVGWIRMTADKMPELIDTYTYHWYAKNEDILSGNVEKTMTEQYEYIKARDGKLHSKGFLMAEAGVFTGRTNGDQQPAVRTFDYGVMMTDYAVQTMRGRMNGISAWDLDDAMHINAGTFGITGDNYPKPPSDITLKVWGFWNSLGGEMKNPDDTKLRPWFYTWALMSRNMRKGGTVISTSNDLPSPIRSVAFFNQDEGGPLLTVVLVNNTEKPRKARLVATGIKPLPVVDVYKYFNDQRQADGDGFPLPEETLSNLDLYKGFEVSFPAKGVVILAARSVSR